MATPKVKYAGYGQPKETSSGLQRWRCDAMNEYHYYRLPDRSEVRLKKCENQLCDQLTTALHCCHACDLASGKHEIHEDGPLGHSALQRASH